MTGVKPRGKGHLSKTFFFFFSLPLRQEGNHFPSSCVSQHMPYILPGCHIIAGSFEEVFPLSSAALPLVTRYRPYIKGSSFTQASFVRFIMSCYTGWYAVGYAVRIECIRKAERKGEVDTRFHIIICLDSTPNALLGSHHFRMCKLNHTCHEILALLHPLFPVWASSILIIVGMIFRQMSTSQGWDSQYNVLRFRVASLLNFSVL